MKKTLISIALTLALLCCALGASAAGNTLIAVEGQNGFDDSISGMTAFGDQLLLGTYGDTFYLYTPGQPLVPVQGIEAFSESVAGYPADEQQDADEDAAPAAGPTVILEEDEYFYLDRTPMATENGLYFIGQVSGEDGFLYALLAQAIIGEDGTITLGEVLDLGDSLAEDYGDGYVGMRSMQNPVALGDVFYALSYGPNGLELVSLDATSGDFDAVSINIDGDPAAMALYDEGRVLLVTNDYTSEMPVANLVIYDIEAQEGTVLGELPRVGYDSPCALCYDTARGCLYYTLGGSVWRMSVSEEGLGEPVAFSDMPIDVYSDSKAVLLGDMYVVSSFDGIIGCDVTREKLPDEHLTIRDMGYIQGIRDAYFPFTAEYPEYSVSIAGSGQTDTLVNDMMNRSTDVDIYTLSSNDPSFKALLSRGFMAELGQSQTLRAAVDSMYPIMRDAVSRDGEIYAVPMSSYLNGLSINETLLIDKFGFTKEDIPTSWPGLFALLDKLEGRMQDVPEASIMAPGYTQDDVRSTLFSAMLESLFLWMDQDEANVMRSSEVLVSLCQALEQVDFGALGIPEQFEENSWSYSEEFILLESYVNGIQSYSSYTAMPLAIEEGGEPLLGTQMTVAFVNPFSEHREAAVRYLEHTLACMDVIDRMQLDPTMNEPVRNAYYEQNMAAFEKGIKELEAALETAEDEQERDELMAAIEQNREYLEEYRTSGSYDVSQQDIERYRALGEHFAVVYSSIWSSTDTIDTIMRYLDGSMTAQQLAAELEKTMQMQRLEGN